MEPSSSKERYNKYKKKYDIFGIGHALLDLEYHVDHDFLAKNSIKQGSMSLVNFEQQQKLRDQLLNNSPDQMLPAGSAANTLFLIRHLGTKVYFHANLGQDVMGKHYQQCLEHTGLKTNVSADKLLPGNTGVCLVMITPDAERTMLTNLGVSDKFEHNSINITEMQRSKYVYIEGYLVTSPIAKTLLNTLITKARESKTKIALTLSDATLVANYHETFIHLMQKNPIDLLFCNQHEACAFAKTDNIDQAKEFLKQYSKQFVITLGADGSCIYDGSEFHYIQGEKVNAINTLGAGDMYAGAYLYAITKGFSPKDAGLFANKASSKIVTQSGPRLSAKEAKLLHPELEKIQKEKTSVEA